MTSTKDKTVQPPLNAKEQPGATASRFNYNPPNGLKTVLSTMFASCTTCSRRTEARTEATSSLTPSSGKGETSAPANVTPSPLHQQKRVSAVKAAIQESSKKLFKNNHDIAQEAIERLRQNHDIAQEAIDRLRQKHQQEQSEKLVTNSLFDSEVAVDAERCSLLSARSSMFSNNQSTLSFNPSTLSNNRTLSTNNRTLSTFDQTGQATQQSQARKTSLQKLIANRANKINAKIPSADDLKPFALKNQEHAFFPASKPKEAPKTRKDKRTREKIKRNKGVPKEVTPKSPVPMLRKRNNQRQKELLNNTIGSSDGLFNDEFNARCEAASKNRNADESWDIENDGISDITQSTVDRMVLAISQHVQVFPEEADTLNRIHSDVTDPAPKTRANTDFFPVDGDAAGFERIVTPPRGGIPTATKGMSPSLMNRTFGSMETKSFFTKTTHSTQTNDFANAWKIDEQKFWDSEVAKESQHHSGKSPRKQTKKRGEASTITTATTTLFTSPQTPPSFFRNHHESEVAEI